MYQKSFSESALTLVVAEDNQKVDVRWQGRSTAREPAKFILPILSEALQMSADLDKPLVLDFQSIEYMNSSTISPVIRILQKAKRGPSNVNVYYRKDLKWQELTFKALEVFETGDGRIRISGV